MSSTSSQPIRAVLFDAYGTLFDVYSVGLLAEQMYPGKGESLAQLWREKQIEYTRVRTMIGRYLPFWDLTVDALIWSAARLGLRLTPEDKGRLMNQYSCLSAFPENQDALKTLREKGMKTAILSNGSPAMIDVALKSAGMHGLFDRVLSADTVRKYKTAPEVYQLGVDAYGVSANDLLFVSSNGWDACAATWFGYTTMWINRNGQPLEELGVQPTAIGTRLTDVIGFIEQRN